MLIKLLIIFNIFLQILSINVEKFNENRIDDEPNLNIETIDDMKRFSNEREEFDLPIERKSQLNRNSNRHISGDDLFDDEGERLDEFRPDENRFLQVCFFSLIGSSRSRKRRWIFFSLRKMNRWSTEMSIDSISTIIIVHGKSNEIEI